MALPTLQPIQQSSLSILPSTGTHGNVVSSLPLGVYGSSAAFVSGAVDQVAFTYAMLGGEVLDIELKESNVYASYEMAVLEYSYLVNLHQSKNSLQSLLGSPTGTFNQDGTLTAGTPGAALKFPKFSLSYARNVSDQIAYESGIGGNVPFYSASINLVDGQQTYDLTNIIIDKANSGDTVLSNALSSSNNSQIRVNKVYFRSPHQVWRFFGYYGGLTVVGNLNTYGQYADDSTFDVVPAWQNKLQAINYETNLFTRTSHYSYEIKNNKINLFPTPTSAAPTKIWFVFSFPPNALSDDPNAKTGVDGVNNMNTLPFENLPYENINSIGKHWIRRYALAIVKGILGNTRGKFDSIPIPGGSVTLNHSTLLSQSTDEMEKLREELKTILDELTYPKIVETEAAIMDNVSKIHQYIPKSIFVG
jgi:hypothetical protein